MKIRTWFLLKLAIKNIRLNWRHSMATGLAVMFGFSAVCLLDGFVHWLTDYNTDRYVNKGMLGDVVIQKKGTIEHLSEDPWYYTLDMHEQQALAAWLKDDPRVQASMRGLSISGLISNGVNSSIFFGVGLDEEQGLILRGDRWKWNTIAGHPLYTTNEQSLLLGTGLARRMDCQFDPTEKLKEDGSYVAEERPLHCANDQLQLSVTTEHSQVNAMTLKMVGVQDFQLRELNDTIVMTRLTLAQQLMDTDRISRVHVLLKDPNQAKDFVQSLRDKAKAAGLPLEIVPWLQHPIAAMGRGGMEILGVFRALFLSIVAVIAAMSVANSMMKSINERIREIGTLRSFGFRRMDIRLLFSFEGLLLGWFSCLGGIAMSWGLAIVIQHSGLQIKAGILSTPMPVTVTIPFLTWALTSGLLSLITFLASWIVSRRAANMNIADALRYVA